jgi:hypothetical protein
MPDTEVRHAAYNGSNRRHDLQLERGNRGMRIDANRIIYRHEGKMVKFRGSTDVPCDLKSAFMDGEWKTAETAKAISYFAGGAIGMEN